MAILLCSAPSSLRAQQVAFGPPTGCEGEAQEKCFCVALIGAIRAPGRFEIHRPVRLIELLAHAGGLTDGVGPTIRITHNSQRKCAELLGNEAAVNTGNAAVYSLSDIRRGDELANPYLHAGDIVDVSGAERAYVVGSVLRPQAIYLRESVTLTQAIALTGGVLPGSRSNKVRLIRQTVGSSTRTQVTVDLKAIRQRRAADLVLQPNDIIDVPNKHDHPGRPDWFGIVSEQVPMRVIY